MSRVPCHFACTSHPQPVSYQTRSRCAQAYADAVLHQRDEPEHIEQEHVPAALSGSEEDQAGREENKVDEFDEVERLCLRLFANKVDHNSTGDSITGNLLDLHATVGAFIPSHQRDRLPRSFKQLAALYKSHMLDILRIPVCRSECMLALVDEAVCNTCAQRMYRYQRASYKDKRPCSARPLC